MRECKLTDQIYDCFDLYCKETCTKPTKDNLAQLLNVERRFFSRRCKLNETHLLAIALFNKYHEPPQYTTTALTDFNESIYQIAIQALTGNTTPFCISVTNLSPTTNKEPRLVQRILRSLKQANVIDKQSDVLEVAKISKREHYENRPDQIKTLVRFLMYCHQQKGHWLHFSHLIIDQLLLRLQVYFNSLAFNKQRNAAQIFG